MNLWGSCFSMSNPINFAELFTAQVKHLSRLLPLIRLYRLFFFRRQVSCEQPSLRRTRNTVLRQKPSRKAISSPVSRFLRNAKRQPRACSVSLLRQCSGRELLSASASEPLCRNRHIPFPAVRRMTPKPAATAAAGATCIRRIISSRPLAASLAFLWLFTPSWSRFAVVC